jgi:hypothetical protein
MEIDFNKIKPLVGGRMVDPRTNSIFPWYTRPFLEKLCSWDIKNWKVFEYGCGDSTFWWRQNVREVISIDTNRDWANKCTSHFTTDKNEFISYPSKFTSEEKFDCIIIDGEPVEWRDECTKQSIESLKDGGILIIDNYKQGTVNLENWPLSDVLLNEKKCEIFQQDGHKDWKTGYWII